MNDLGRLEILPGRDRAGNPEVFGPIVLDPGDRLAVVGPTGSGKSRLLADIEWAADGDTPSGRRILWDGQALSADRRLDGPVGRVAQISQTMSFLMDLPVLEFLRLHSQAHGIEDPRAAEEAYEASQELSGEGFGPEVRLPSLSGGQSRALMIADVAVLGRAPVVLVDEIENAGVDRDAALALLSGKGRIVLLATHDPLLALSAPRRAVLGNGGIRAVQERSVAEEGLLLELAGIHARSEELRRRMRAGEGLA
jgi:ABC-type lipoprotein export system ATPase subunit